MTVFKYENKVHDIQRLTAMRHDSKINKEDVNQIKESVVEKKSEDKFEKPVEKKKDIYTDTPVRYLGFANEVGAAVSPAAGALLEMLTYIPALSYIAMDVRDKWKRGDDDSYKDKSVKRGTQELAFQTLASVLFPTCVVKTAQIIVDKAIDKFPKISGPILNPVRNFVKSKPGLDKFIAKFKDKPFDKLTAKPLEKFAHGFVDVINKITILPGLIPARTNKSGMRNIGLAVVGLTALFSAVKPIDKAAEKIIEHLVHPALYGSSNKSKENEAAPKTAEAKA